MGKDGSTESSKKAIHAAAGTRMSRDTLSSVLRAIRLRGAIFYHIRLDTGDLVIFPADELPNEVSQGD